MLKFMKVSTQKNIKFKFLVVLLTSVFVLMIDLLDQLTIVIFRGEDAAYEFVKVILEEYEPCKKVIKKYLNKNLTISEQEEEQFQLSNMCWICKKPIDNDDENVRDHCHVTGTFRGDAHWSCNINLPLTKIVPVIFHNLRGYDSHLIFNELSKLDVKIDVISNGREKYMTFF